MLIIRPYFLANIDQLLRLPSHQQQQQQQQILRLQPPASLPTSPRNPKVPHKPLALANAPVAAAARQSSGSGHLQHSQLTARPPHRAQRPARHQGLPEQVLRLREPLWAEVCASRPQQQSSVKELRAIVQPLQAR